jgi:hypothetical protein
MDRRAQAERFGNNIKGVLTLPTVPTVRDRAKADQKYRLAAAVSEP